MSFAARPRSLVRAFAESNFRMRKDALRRAHGCPHHNNMAQVDRLHSELESYESGSPFRSGIK